MLRHTSFIYVNHPKASVGSVRYKYQIAYKVNSSDPYIYDYAWTSSSNGFIWFGLMGARSFYYQIRIIVEKDGKKLAYGPWSTTRKVQ